MHLFLQSIFGFNGADSSGFDSFRRDFPNYKEVWLARLFQRLYQIWFISLRNQKLSPLNCGCIKIISLLLIQVRLIKNYRSSRHIVEAASSIIKNNTKRCQSKSISSENSQGSKASWVCLYENLHHLIATCLTISVSSSIDYRQGMP